MICPFWRRRRGRARESGRGGDADYFDLADKPWSSMGNSGPLISHGYAILTIDFVIAAPEWRLLSVSMTVVGAAKCRERVDKRQFRERQGAAPLLLSAVAVGQLQMMAVQGANR